MRKKLYKAQFYWDSRAISMKFNPNDALELRYEGQKCNKISRFIAFSIAVYPEQGRRIMVKLKNDAIALRPCSGC